MRRIIFLSFIFICCIGTLITLAGCNSDSSGDSPTGPGDTSEIPDTLYGIWMDDSYSVRYIFTEDTVQHYYKQSGQWVLLYDYKENGYTITYEADNQVSIYLAEQYTIGFYIGENGNLYSDNGDLYATKRDVVARNL